MRVLFVAAPGVGHLMPAVPTLWAAQEAGHTVLVATTGPSLEMAARSGLAAVDVSDGDAADTYHRLGVWVAKNRPDRYDLPGAWHRFVGGASVRRDPATADSPPGPAPDDPPQPAPDDPPGAAPDDAVALAHGVGGQMVDRTVDLIRRWRADLLVFTTFLSGGQLAAEAAGIPCVMHGIGLPYPTFAEVLSAMADVCARHGVTGALTPPVATVDLCPESLCPESLRPPGGATGWPMRYVPYNGGAVLPDWLCAAPRRPRVCVTWGSVLPAVGCTSMLRDVVEAVAAEDAEVVLTAGEAELSGLGPLPPNVRAVDWVPLSALLPSCAAVVHHGGSGTTFTALAHGVPQLVLPQTADQPVNAQAVVERGTGLAFPDRDVDRGALADGVRRALTDQRIREACRQVRDEIRAMPGPERVVRRLSEVAS
ncbi:nucleotide disphospho-sugar-binding domain-containing protein [Kitasatospora sp. NPDC056651]|uniref:nucleotide disphospho-sugar-binding domain-containing protein n=1 Tax=Kitasatospora sp. NPDC056651 TaxID=3345892 RepID=UPI0036ACFF09